MNKAQSLVNRQTTVSPHMMTGNDLRYPAQVKRQAIAFYERKLAYFETQSQYASYARAAQQTRELLAVLRTSS